MTRLIDEEEAFKVLSAYYKHRYYEQDEALLDALSRVPTAVPVKRGHWIEKSTGGEYFDRCSECGYIEWGAPNNYCPECGARMDEE